MGTSLPLLGENSTKLFETCSASLNKLLEHAYKFYLDWLRDDLVMTLKGSVCLLLQRVFYQAEKSRLIFQDVPLNSSFLLKLEQSNVLFPFSGGQKASFSVGDRGVSSSGTREAHEALMMDMEENDIHLQTKM